MVTTRSLWWPIPHRFLHDVKFTEGDGQEVYYGHAAGAVADQPAGCDCNSIRISRRQKEAISLANVQMTDERIVLRLVFVTAFDKVVGQHVFKGSLRIPMSEGQ
jgi:hypothetical protein